MSGFFLVRRSCLDLVSLHPQGFMLLLAAPEHSYPTGRTPTCGASIRSRISIARPGCPCPVRRRHR